MEMGKSFDLSLQVGIFRPLNIESYIFIMGIIQAIFFLVAMTNIRRIELDLNVEMASQIGDKSGLFIFVIFETLLIVAAFFSWKIYALHSYTFLLFLLAIITNFALVWVAVRFLTIKIDNSDTLGELGTIPKITTFTFTDLALQPHFSRIRYLLLASIVIVSVASLFDNHIMIFSYYSSSYIQTLRDKNLVWLFDKLGRFVLGLLVYFT